MAEIFTFNKEMQFWLFCNPEVTNIAHNEREMVRFHVSNKMATCREMHWKLKKRQIDSIAFLEYIYRWMQKIV